MNSEWLDTRASRQLGVSERIAKTACVAGMRYPLPRWFLEMPTASRFIFRLFYIIVELSLIPMIMTNVVLLSQKAMTNIGVLTECTGSLLFFTLAYCKSQFIYHKRDLLDRVMDKLHKVAKQLEANPTGNSKYMMYHLRQCRLLQLYCDVKLYALMVSFILVAFNRWVPGMLNPGPDIPTPMLAWYPMLDYSSRLHFTLICIVQPLQYLLIAWKDFFADVTVMLTLAAINAQIIFMRLLLLDIVAMKSNNRRLLAYWVRLHQDILSILDDFKAITGPCLFGTYMNVCIFLFFVLLRLTEDDDYAWTQQVAIIGMTLSNLVQLYILSYIGDELANNSMAMADAAESQSLWDLPRSEQRTVLQLAVRCTKPSQIIFGDNRKLCLASFLDIVTAMFSYFNTVYQLRH